MEQVCIVDKIGILITYHRGSIRDVLDMLPGESFIKTDKNIVAKNKKRKAGSKKVIHICNC